MRSIQPGTHTLERLCLWTPPARPKPLQRGEGPGPKLARRPGDGWRSYLIGTVFSAGPESRLERSWARAVWGRQLDLALADCNESLRLRPNDANTVNSRGLVQFRRNDFRAAFADYDAAVRANANDTGSLFALGVAQLRLGQTAAGQADIAAATARDAGVAARYAGYGVSP